jgi:hypothetical protein
MLKNINQAHPLLITPIQHYGCYFLCLAEASPIVFKGDEGALRLNGIWAKATELGYISGDINHDGDVDDDGEAEIQNPTELANRFFGLNVKYDGKHHLAEEVIPPTVKIIIGQFWWKGGHFVLINRLKKVTFDSYGKSNTVRNGYLKTMRWFYAV